ncbi:hypothetical protein BT67DRAFT_133110 [Trichocladium antarcticum]|uniref:Uncharacterized protein n=1 Tax=Trichocladium antarcticum TaxID=1450529 RepID=A0AAN6ZBS8_9PEZI|nr:hypothetical protein BT67DRAFT_133110 [Trichocladium antarcticum]
MAYYNGTNTYPQFVRYSCCHFVPSGVVRGEGSGPDHQRFHFVFKDEQLCPNCEMLDEQEQCRTKGWLQQRQHFKHQKKWIVMTRLGDEVRVEDPMGDPFNPTEVDLANGNQDKDEAGEGGDGGDGAERSSSSESNSSDLQGNSTISDTDTREEETAD